MKNIKILSVLLVLGVLLASCEKEQKKEWNKLYGYSNEDIIGSYSFSNITDAFDGLTESTYCHICEDAQIVISGGSGSTIEFKVNCPSDNFNKTFEGLPRLTDDDFLINMTDPSSRPIYELTVYVYKNGEGKIRLHGFARRVFYSGTTEEYKINYYFDVIKN